MQERVNEKLTMRFTHLRDLNEGLEMEPGYRLEANNQIIAVDSICYAWNLVRVTQGIYGFPERERISGDWRMFVAADYDVRERDLIQNIYVPMRVGLMGPVTNHVICEGPIAVRFVGGHSGYKLLMLDEVR